MRDPKRIKTILSLIESIWTQQPNLRLCQLLGNRFSAGDLYFIEDYVLQEELEKYKRKINNE